LVKTKLFIKNLLKSDFANIGWTGWVGSIQGYSSTRMAISEIGVSFPDDTFGKESRFGTPFTVSFLFKTLRFCKFFKVFRLRNL